MATVAQTESKKARRSQENFDRRRNVCHHFKLGVYNDVLEYSKNVGYVITFIDCRKKACALSNFYFFTLCCF